MENHLSESDNQKLQNATPSGNERRALLTCLTEASLVLRLPCELHLFRAC
jgi:hypothetical protein